MTLKVHVYFLLAYACKAMLRMTLELGMAIHHPMFCKCCRIKHQYPHIYFWTWTFKTLPGYGQRRSNIQPNSDSNNKTFLTCSPGTESTPLRKSTTPTILRPKEAEMEEGKRREKICFPRIKREKRETSRPPFPRRV